MFSNFSQYPIANGEHLTYNFTPVQYGQYWYVLPPSATVMSRIYGSIHSSAFFSTGTTPTTTLNSPTVPAAP